MNRLLLVFLLWLGLISQAMAQTSTTATVVYGQNGSFTTGTANKGGVSANGLFDPADGIVDSTGGLYVSDSGNNRVLHYPAGSTTADRVYGQRGSFTTRDANKGGISADSLYGPSIGTLDATGGLYVTDYYNSRVLHYPAGSTTADRVYGQGGSFTSNTDNLNGISADSLFGPTGVTLDATGGIYVTDGNNNRVLHYPAGSTTADRVYGQGGSFTSNTDNLNGISADSLSGPGGLNLDNTGGLYVSDSDNHRVLYYPAGSTTATVVYGQGGNFTTNTINNGGVSANSLSGPGGLYLDNTGGLYVADGDNNRVLHSRPAAPQRTRSTGSSGALPAVPQTKGGPAAIPPPIA